MRIALPLSFVLAMALAPAALGQEIRRINTCFEESVAALRLSQLEDGVTQCDRVIEDKATPADRRGQAYAQRGLMYARRWSILSTPITLASQGIADITQALSLHTPPSERKHQLLFIRAQLYAATGQTRRSIGDYSAILNDDPSNTEARRARDRLGSPESN